MRGFESHQRFRVFFFIFIVSYFHMCPLSIIGTVLTFIQSVHQMGHYQTRKRIYATECINSIGYALFAVIKVSKGAKIRNRYNQVK